MKLNQSVTKNLEQLRFENQFYFALSCSSRSIELYKSFDSMVELENLEPLINGKSGYFVLNSFLNKGYDVYLGKEVLNTEEANLIAERCYELAPGDEDYGDLSTIIAQFVANCLAYAFEFYAKRDRQYLEWASDSLIELINILESERFYTNNDDGGDSDEILDEYFFKEAETQNHIIALLRQNVNHIAIKDFVEENMIV